MTKTNQNLITMFATSAQDTETITATMQKRMIWCVIAMIVYITQ